MRILITGTSSGIGKAIALKFLCEGHEVIGIDKKPASFENDNYVHITADISSKLPNIEKCDILINNAGVQNENDIDVNLKGTINVTETYGIHEGIKSILFIASASATTGSEFPEYVASKGGVLAYMKNVALRVANYGATCNSLSPGGVTTELNRHVMDGGKFWNEIMDLTPLKKWASPDEIAMWAYFVTVINKSMTAQDIIIDNGESSYAKFVW